MRAKESSTPAVDHAETLERLEREVAKSEQLAAHVAAQILERRKHKVGLSSNQAIPPAYE